MNVKRIDNKSNALKSKPDHRILESITSFSFVNFWKQIDHVLCFF